jgi:hypothetical protein
MSSEEGERSLPSSEIGCLISGEGPGVRLITLGASFRG